MYVSVCICVCILDVSPASSWILDRAGTSKSERVEDCLFIGKEKGLRMPSLLADIIYFPQSL